MSHATVPYAVVVVVVVVVMIVFGTCMLQSVTCAKGMHDRGGEWRGWTGLRRALEMGLW